MREVAKVARLQVVATGMHLLPRHGMTLREIEADGFRVDAQVPMLSDDDTMAGMARSVGAGIQGFVDAFERLDPDVVLVLGDRVEMLAAAVAASYSGRFVAHVHGGDRTQGGLDEYSRHAITKISHVHLAATEVSAGRIRRMGERPETVFVVGAPGLDEVLAGDPYDPAVCRQYGVEPGRYLLAVFHPVSTDPALAEAETRTLVDALLEQGLPIVAVFPNADAGSGKVIAELDRRKDRVQVHPTLPRAHYLALLAHAAALAGNSSSGIIEAPALGVPAVNVGPRQEGRERGRNVLDAPAEPQAMRAALRTALHDEAFRRQAARREHPYGDGRASARIAQVLAGVPLEPSLRRKIITY